MAKRITDEQMNVNMVINGGNEAKKKLGDLEQNYRNLKTEQDDLRKAKQRLIAEGKKESAEYKKIEADLKKTKVAMDQNKDSQKAMREEIGLTGLTMGQLVKEQRRLTSQIKHGTTKGTEDYNRLKKELQQVNNVIDEQRKDLRGTEDAMGDTADAAERLSGAFGDIFQGLQSGNMQQVGAGFMVIKKNIVGATRAAMAFIATPIGIALAALGGIAVAAKSWYDYNSAAVEALRTTQQITNLSDRAADNARIRAKVITETFGGEFKENLEAARNLVMQFGISYDQAFDVIEDKLIRGQKNNDEFFDSLREYPTFFAEAKFSAEEFANVIAAGYDLGIYNDKLTDALKEADVSLREQTTATRDALLNAFGAPFTDDILQRIDRGETSIKDALQEISAESQKQNISIQQNAQLTADLFRGAGEDAGGAIKVFKALNVALNEQQRELRESEEIQQQQLDTNKELEQVMSALFGTGDEGFGLLIDKASLFGTKVLVKILETGVDVINWFVELNNKSAVFSGILATFGTIATAGFEIIGTLIDNAKEQFGGLGDMIEGIFTLDAEKIKQGFARASLSSGQVMEDLKNKAIEAKNEIAAAFSGANKMQRVSIGSIVTSGNESSSTNNTGGPGGTPEGEETNIDAEATKRADEEKKIREKVAQQLEEWERERSMEKEELELVKKEEEFEKLKEEAAGDLELIAGLEEEKQLQLQDIRDRYAEERLQKETLEKEKLRKLEEEFATASANATIELEQTKARALQFGLGTLRSFFDKKSGIYKALFLLEKGAAVANVMNNTSKALAEIAANTAAANAKAVAASPLTGGMPWVGINTATGAKQALSVKLNTAMQLASIAGTAIQEVQGFEDGLYPDYLNVTRTDGKKYRARFGGDAGTRLVNEPTYFTNNGGYLAAENRKTEMVIDNGTFRRLDPAVVNHIMDVHHRVPGHETGLYPANSEASVSSDPEMKALMQMLAQRLSEPIRTYTVYGYDDEERRQEIQNEITNSRNNGNLTP